MIWGFDASVYFVSNWDMLTIFNFIFLCKWVYVLSPCQTDSVEEASRLPSAEMTWKMI